jgi:hypothetical protein
VPCLGPSVGWSDSLKRQSRAILARLSTPDVKLDSPQASSDTDQDLSRLQIDIGRFHSHLNQIVLQGVVIVNGEQEVEISPSFLRRRSTYEQARNNFPI